jgi:putative transposase
MPEATERRKRGRPPLTPEQRKQRGSWVPRVKRPSVDPLHPLHVTIRAKKDVPGFRTTKRFLRMRESIRRASDRFGMRVVHFTVMDNHVHLIVEARDRRALSRGMQGLVIRLAKAANGKWRSGKVFRDRYHAVELDTAIRVRHAIAYVLLNGRRHERPKGPAEALDPCSSAYWFDGWKRDVTALKAVTEAAMEMGDPPVVKPRTWLLRIGWLQTWRIDPSEVPGPKVAPSRG